MSRVALIGLALAGCFYTESVNQRPSLDIHRENEGPYYRGAVDPNRDRLIELSAEENDPEGDHVSFRWRAYACTEQASCDQAPYFEKSDRVIKVPVPTARFDVADPIKGIFIKLEGKDDYGAVARPVQELWVDVGNAPPTIVSLAPFSDLGYVEKMPVTIFAEVIDTDDRERKPDYTWSVFPSVAYTEVSATPAQGGYAFGIELTSPPLGKYTVTFTASDGIVETPSSDMIDVMIVPDKPPCLSTLSPLVAVAPAALPISDPTLFQVNVVNDDLDPYPASSNPLRGTTKFTWSLLAPGSSRQVLTGVTGNSVSINPASYQPGDILELRVEIADRKNTPIPCADPMASCSVTASGCLQRQTWRVEVR